MLFDPHHIVTDFEPEFSKLAMVTLPDFFENRVKTVVEKHFGHLDMSPAYCHMPVTEAA